jgi:RNA polymerase sigma factor (TIGR02999 family)
MSGEQAGAKAGPNDKTPARMLEKYYAEYRQLAHRILARDSAAAYIQPTELAHEAALRIFNLKEMDIAGRTHFLSISARVMRQVLLDEVRRFRAQKRQAPPVITQWDDEPSSQGSFDIEDFNESLTRLEAIDPQRASVVEKRFFAGMTIEEIAFATGVSERTVKRQWRVARAWLLNELSQ